MSSGSHPIQKTLWNDLWNCQNVFWMSSQKISVAALIGQVWIIFAIFPYLKLHVLWNYFYRRNISQSDYSIKKLFTGLNSFFIFVPKQHWFEIMTCVLIVTLSATNNQNISINKTIFCERQNIPKKKKTAIKLFWKARSHAWFCVSSDLYPAPTVCNHFYPFSNLDPLFWTTV